MNKRLRKIMAFVMALSLLFSVDGLNNAASVSAAKAPKLSTKKVTVQVKKSKTVKLKNKPKKAKVTWSSKNKKIAAVNKKGKITGKKVGKTKVICKVTYKKGSKKVTKKLTVNVTVKKAAAVSTSTPAPSQPASAAASAAAPSKAPTAVPPVEPTAAATSTPVPTVAPPTFTVKSDDTTNIGEERKVSIVGGTSESMTVKDNGVMRKDLSTQYLIDNEMGEGINLGNTMEATKALGEIKNFTEATDFEQAWGAPITTQKYIDGIHSYGFNTLRIPVAWSSMVSDDGKYTIDDKMLGRVEEIANYALNNGMYVIIDIHWDYGWWGQFGSKDEAVADAAWARYRSYWKQITERFKDYSDHLIFESANEELGACLFDAVDENGYRADPHEHSEFTEEQKYKLTNDINQEFVNIVRASGGNNAYRHLLIAGDNTNIENTVNDNFHMPKDTIEENGNTKLSISVHYYSPWDFCGDGMMGADYSQEDYEYTVAQFDLMKKFTDQGYGVMIGEFSVCNPRQDGVYEWLRDTMSLAAERGLLPILWDTPGMYFDRDACQMNYRDIAELYNAITGANGETESIEATTGKPANEIGIVDVPNTEPVWKWEGKWAKNDAKNIGLDGEVVTKTDVTKFVKTDFCTDDTKITFNGWGYQAFMNLDWSQYKKPCLAFTFAEDTEEVVGTLILATVKKVNGSGTDEQAYLYAMWNGKGVVLASTTLESFQEKPYLYLTFGNRPTITGIYVYDLGE